MVKQFINATVIYFIAGIVYFLILWAIFVKKEDPVVSFVELVRKEVDLVEKELRNNVKENIKNIKHITQQLTSTTNELHKNYMKSLVTSIELEDHFKHELKKLQKAEALLKCETKNITFPFHYLTAAATKEFAPPLEFQAGASWEFAYHNEVYSFIRAIIEDRLELVVNSLSRHEVLCKEVGCLHVVECLVSATQQTERSPEGTRLFYIIEPRYYFDDVLKRLPAALTEVAFD